MKLWVLDDADFGADYKGGTVVVLADTLPDAIVQFVEYAAAGQDPLNPVLRDDDRYELPGWPDEDNTDARRHWLQKLTTYPWRTVDLDTPSVVAFHWGCDG